VQFHGQFAKTTFIIHFEIYMALMSPGTLLALLVGILILSSHGYGAVLVRIGLESENQIESRRKDELDPIQSSYSNFREVVFAKSASGSTEARIDELNRKITEAEIKERYGGGSKGSAKPTATSGISPDRQVGTDKSKTGATTAATGSSPGNDVKPSSSKGRPVKIKRRGGKKPDPESSATATATTTNAGASDSSAKQENKPSKPVRVRRGRRKPKNTDKGSYSSSRSSSRSSADTSSSKGSVKSSKDGKNPVPSRRLCKKCVNNVGRKAVQRYFESKKNQYIAAVKMQCSAIAEAQIEARQGCIQHWKTISKEDPWANPLSYCEDSCKGIPVSDIKMKKLKLKFPKVKLIKSADALKAVGASASQGKYRADPISPSDQTSSIANPQIPSQSSNNPGQWQPGRPAQNDPSQSRSSFSDPNDDKDDDDYQSSSNNGATSSIQTSNSDNFADDGDYSPSSSRAYNDASSNMDEGTRRNICAACANWMFDSTKQLRADFHSQICKCDGNCFVPDNWWVLLKAPCKALLATTTFVASREVGLTGTLGACSVVCTGMVLKDAITGQPIGSK
jgi:hypothetical protein